MTDRRPPTSVDFDPIRLRPAGRRRFDPAVVGALVVVVALAVAIVKPWGGPVGLGSGDHAETAAPLPSPAEAPLAAPGEDAAASDPRTAVRYLSALRPHDGWGARAVVAAPGTTDLAERWLTAEFGWGYGGPELVADLDAGSDDVLALGVTTPAEAAPLAVRVYAIGGDGEPHWLDTGRVASDLPAAELLLLPPAIDGVATHHWPAGEYRFDLLMGQRITQMRVMLGSAARTAPRPTTPPPRGPDRAAIPPAWLGNVPAGVFAVVDGVVRPLAGEPGPPLDPAGLWLDTATGGLAGTVSRVASAPHAGAARVGVMLPGGAHDASGLIRRLTPGSGPEVRVAQTGARVDASNNPTAFLLFRAPDGDAWPPGMYALEATWIGPGGPQAATWHLELTPGSGEDATNLVAAAGSFAPFAGQDSLLAGSVEQLRDPEEAAEVRPRPIGRDPADPPASLRSIGCDDAVIGAGPPVIGLSHPVDRVPLAVELSVRGPFDRSSAFALRTAIDVLPGLTLLAPGNGSAFPSSVYRLTIRDAAGVRELKVCIGTSPFNG